MDKIDQYLLSLPDSKRAVALELREIILLVDKKITEAIKWNNLTFTIGKNNFAFIYTFQQVDYINLGFFQAVDLMDPKKLFEGTGEKMRHIKVKTPKDIPVAQVKKWVKEVVALNADR